MKVIRKSLILIIIVFIIRIVQSCCSCGEEPIPFDYETISLRNIDNSGSYVTWSDNDIMYAKAVSFEVDVTGIPEVGFLNFINPVSGFESANACDCNPIFAANQEIEKVSITTLNSISPEIPADSDVTELFLALSSTDNNSTSHLYLTFENLYSIINANIYSDSPETSFQIFCKEEILNDVAQFTVTIELSDGRSLTGTTPVITILPNS